ncbi:MAG: N-acetyltransferase [Frankiales bacterium]|nr:N-acetyltransferase [Frankiales bacterium]
MDIRPVQDRDSLQAFHQVTAAAHAHDYLALPADPVEELLPLLEEKEQAGELVLLFLASDDVAPVGTLQLSFPTLDNLMSANLQLTVHPDHRREGHARRLLQFGIAQVRARGRSRIFMEVPSPAGGGDIAALALMTEVGARPVLEDYRRLLDLVKHPVGEPLRAPEGYRVVQWLDRAPDELVDGAAYLLGRMTVDSPMGDMEYEQEKWDATRYREKEEAAAARRRTRLATAVVHVASGAVAGITSIGVNRDHPEVVYQWDTIVDPEHRGHRLGLVLKSWNHQQLKEQVPDAAFVNTWNAASNTFMVAVNDALGFEPAEAWTQWQLDL